MTVRAFYDELAPWYHLVYRDWAASMQRQGAALAALIAECWSPESRPGITARPRRRARGVMSNTDA